MPHLPTSPYGAFSPGHFHHHHLHHSQSSTLPYNAASRIRVCKLVLFVILSNFAGHSIPLLWSAEFRTILLSSSVFRTNTATLNTTTQEHAVEFAQAMSVPRVHSSVAVKSKTDRKVKGGKDDSHLIFLDMSNAGGEGWSGRRDEELRQLRVLELANKLSDDVSDESLRVLSQSVEELHRDRWKTPFVKHVEIDLGDEGSCKRIVPPKSLEIPIDSSLITSLSDVLQPDAPRLLLLLPPSSSLGAFFSAFVSSFIYASLSHRHLVLLHAGEFSRILDIVCESFECPFSAIRASSAGDAEKFLPRLQQSGKETRWLDEWTSGSANFLEHLSSPLALVMSRGFSLDALLHRHKDVQACLFAAFRCDSLWCLQSRALFALLGRGPSRLVADTIPLVLRRNVDYFRLFGQMDANGFEEVAADEEEQEGGEAGGTMRQRGLSWFGGVSSRTRQRRRQGGQLGLEEDLLHRGSSSVLSKVERTVEARFDVAVHLRLHAELSYLNSRQQKGVREVECIDPPLSPSSSQASLTCSENSSFSSTLSSSSSFASPSCSPLPRYLRRCFWKCLHSVFSSTEKRRRAASGPGSHRRRRQLSIFLSTDDERLRTFLVKKLERFGAVYYASAKLSASDVASLAASSSSDSAAKGVGMGKRGGDTMDVGSESSLTDDSISSSSSSNSSPPSRSVLLSSKKLSRTALPTMSEFFLLSKSGTLIEANSQLSAFAYFASLFGNSSLATVDFSQGMEGCGLRWEHRAEEAVA